MPGHSMFCTREFLPPDLRIGVLQRNERCFLYSPSLFCCPSVPFGRRSAWTRFIFSRSSRAHSWRPGSRSTERVFQRGWWLQISTGRTFHSSIMQCRSSVIFVVWIRHLDIFTKKILLYNWRKSIPLSRFPNRLKWWILLVLHWFTYRNGIPILQRNYTIPAIEWSIRVWMDGCSARLEA